LHFDISNNNIRAEGGKALAKALKGNQVIAKLSIAKNKLSFNSSGEQDMSGVATLADAIPGMGALTKVGVRQNDIHGAKAGKAFADMLAQNTALKELDLSSQAWSTHNGLDAAFAKQFAVGLSNNGAMTSLHVGKNKIPEKQMRELMAIAMGMDNMKILCEVPFKDKTITELDISGKNLGIEGTLVVAEYLDGNGAMTKFNISLNDIRAEGGKALAVGLKGNQVITELNISSNRLGQNSDCDGDTSGVIAIADAISDMRAILTFTFSGDDNSKPVTMETSMVEADFCEKGLGESGAIMVAAFLPKCT
jgi:hypothetical protein